MKFEYPIAFAINFFSITVILVFLVLAGNSELAADVGLIQGATIALFYAFTANARNLILNERSLINAKLLLFKRLILVIPLGISAYFLSTITDVSQYIAIALIVRRSIEWINEVVMSYAEKNTDNFYAKKYNISQIIILTILLISYFIVNEIYTPIFYIWALSPIYPGIGVIKNILIESSHDAMKRTIELLPHIGSTAVIGITVYVFRLFLVLIAGKVMAGQLFAAFSLGGILGSVFANAIGPSIALQGARMGNIFLPLYIKYILFITSLIGLSLVILSITMPENIFFVRNESIFFLKALGFSLLGGVVMVIAQNLRLKLVQLDEGQNVFGPDVIVNILIISSIPFLYLLIDKQALSVLYLLSACLSLFFYFSATKQSTAWKHAVRSMSNYVKSALIVVLLLPIFFKLDGSIYALKTRNYDTGGIIGNLPIPIGVISCFIGIILLGFYDRAKISLVFIFFTFVLMIIASTVTTLGLGTEEQAKFIYLIQFILPMFALVYGQQYLNDKHDYQIFVKSAFIIVLTVITANVISTLISDKPHVLSPYVFFFSIYQSIQYVSVILIGIYLVTIFSLWNYSQYKKYIILSIPVIAIYAAQSISILTISLLISGFLIFSLYYYFNNEQKLPIFLFLLLTITCFTYFDYYKDDYSFKFEQQTITDHQGTDDREKVTLPKNISQRSQIWNYYIELLNADKRSIFFGSNTRPNRDLYPSAHNYYLDYIYSFGLISILPLFILIGYTLYLIYISRKRVFTSESLLGLVYVTLFLIFVDNFFKVGLRQPYPGIITFFIWGILLSTLMHINNKR